MTIVCHNCYDTSEYGYFEEDPQSNLGVEISSEEELAS